jgi:hypothetical protein
VKSVQPAQKSTNWTQNEPDFQPPHKESTKDNHFTQEFSQLSKEQVFQSLKERGHLQTPFIGQYNLETQNLKKSRHKAFSFMNTKTKSPRISIYAKCGNI